VTWLRICHDAQQTTANMGFTGCLLRQMSFVLLPLIAPAEAITGRRSPSVRFGSNAEDPTMAAGRPFHLG